MRRGQDGLGATGEHWTGSPNKKHRPNIKCLALGPFCSGKKKTNKHKHFRRDGVRDKQEPSLGQMGPLPGTKWDPSLGQTGLSLFNSTVKSPFCPVCPWDGWGFVPGTIVPQGPSEKCLCVFCLLVFFAPNLRLRDLRGPFPL